MDTLTPLSQEPLERENSFNVQDYLQIIKKRKWIIISVFIVFVVTEHFYTERQKPQYRATSRILMSIHRPNLLQIQDIMQGDTASYEYLQTQFEIIKSRKLIGKVIDEMDLLNSPEFFPKPPKKSKLSISSIKKWVVNQSKSILNRPSAKKNVDSNKAVSHHIPIDYNMRKKEALYQRIVSRLEVSIVSESRLVDINFIGYNPALITKFVNTLTKFYINQNLENRVFASEDAQQWLDEKLQSMELKVEESEKALQIYSREAGAVSLENKIQILDNQIASLISDITKTRKDRITLEALYKSSQNPAIAESLTEVVKNNLIQSLNLELANLNQTASEIKERYGPKHPKSIRINTQIDEIKNTLKLETQKIHESIRTDLEIAEAGEKSLVDALERLQNEASSLQEKSIKYGVLKRKTQSNRQMFDLVLQRLKETDLSQGYRTNNIRLVDPAIRPLGPFKPNKRKNFLFGIAFGLFGGLGLAFLIENLDNSVKEPDEIMAKFGVPFLGLVGSHSMNSSKLNQKNGKSILSNLVTIVDPSSNISESLRTIRTNVLFSADGDRQKILMITSALPSEGKTTVASNLAVVMASLGEKVLLIDADLRRPSIHKIFNIKKSPGLSGYLIRQDEYSQILANTEVENLTVIPSGIVPPNPSELLSHPQLLELIKLVGKNFDRVIIDTPPVASVSDPMIISKSSDATIMVIRCGETAREIVQRAIQQLNNVNTKIIGAILNAVDFSKDSYYYQYYYKHYYYKEEADKTEA